MNTCVKHHHSTGNKVSRLTAEVLQGTSLHHCYLYLLHLNFLAVLGARLLLAECSSSCRQMGLQKKMGFQKNVGRAGQNITVRATGQPPPAVCTTSPKQFRAGGALVGYAP